MDAPSFRPHRPPRPAVHTPPGRTWGAEAAAAQSSRLPDIRGLRPGIDEPLLDIDSVGLFSRTRWRLWPNRIDVEDRLLHLFPSRRTVLLQHVTSVERGWGGKLTVSTTDGDEYHWYLGGWAEAAYRGLMVLL
jgi:hypothetical protein